MDDLYKMVDLTMRQNDEYQARSGPCTVFYNKRLASRSMRSSTYNRKVPYKYDREGVYLLAT
jgi:hypothetical protein